MLDDKDEFVRDDPLNIQGFAVLGLILGITASLMVVVGLFSTFNNAMKTAKATVEAQHLSNQKTLDAIHHKAQQILAENDNVGR